MGEQVETDFADHLLGYADHQLVVTVAGRGPGQVQPGHENDHPGQTRQIAGNDIGVDHRL